LRKTHYDRDRRPTYRRARIKAAERGTSVSALVKQYLAKLGREPDRAVQLRRAEDQLRAEITNFRAGDRRRRDQLHNREI
jgi:hypothetical protein